jgi:hypothetical protein
VIRINFYEIVPGHEPEDAGVGWADQVPQIGAHVTHLHDGEVCWRVVDVSIHPSDTGSQNHLNMERGRPVQLAIVEVFVVPTHGLHGPAPVDPSPHGIRPSDNVVADMIADILRWAADEIEAQDEAHRTDADDVNLGDLTDHIRCFDSQPGRGSAVPWPANVPRPS